MTNSGQTIQKTAKSIPTISRKNIIMAFVIWTLLGLSFASEAYLRHYKAEMLVFSAWMYVVEILTSTYIYAAFSPIVFFLERKFPLKFGVSAFDFLARAFIHLIFSLVFSMISLYLGSFIAYQWQGETYCKGCLDWHMLLDPFLLHRGILIYWGLIFVGQGLEYFRSYNNEKIRVAELSSQLSEAHLSALKMQIHPHFLFNTLNSIVGLIQEDKDAAETMTMKLSDFLRLTLQSSNEPIVTLKQEFYFLKTYLDIEKVRFQERLSIEFVYDETVLSAKIPNLILQPLVENSIKHGISRLKENGKIKISAVRREDRLILEVTDNGNRSEQNQIDSLTAKTGLGLKNIEARLSRIYGENFSFKFAENAEKGTAVTINIPFES